MQRLKQGLQVSESSGLALSSAWAAISEDREGACTAISKETELTA